MNNRAERKRHREQVTNILIDIFVEKLEMLKSYADAMEATERVIKQTAEGDSRNKELYKMCWNECEQKTVKIAEEYLSESNSDARKRKMIKYKLFKTKFEGAV